jgi:16S rRNA (cytidine1402-2'-O)-methyltransferase
MGKIILLNMAIGQKEDLTLRIWQTLQKPGVFFVEDTRTFRDHLTRWGLPLEGKQLHAFHEHSDLNLITQKCTEYLLQGDVYLCSDAGSPLISDPAYPLIQWAIQQGIELDSQSGITALTMALELSGFAPLPLHFHGFLSREKGEQKKYFSQLTSGTHFFYEAPTRILETVDLAVELFPQARFAIIKELTKPFQNVWRFTGIEWANHKTKVVTKGEFVWGLEISGENTLTLKDKSWAQELNKWIEQGGTQKELAKILSQVLDRSSKEIYAQLQAHKK